MVRRFHGYTTCDHLKQPRCEPLVVLTNETERIHQFLHVVKHANEHLALLWSRNSQAVKRTHVYTLIWLAEQASYIGRFFESRIAAWHSLAFSKEGSVKIELCCECNTSGLVYYHTDVQPANLLASRLENQESSQDRRSHLNSSNTSGEGWLVWRHSCAMFVAPGARCLTTKDMKDHWAITRQA